MTIEEKAKRYDEAVINGSRLWECGEITRENYEYIFPELKESEDDRIRKTIKYGLDHVFTNNTTIFEVTKEQCLAWLEKQCEQKPTWNEEDDRLLDNCISLIEDIDCTKEEQEWLKSLKDRYTWKPSDEQMVALQEAMNIVGILTITGSKINSLYQDLKKLKG